MSGMTFGSKGRSWVFSVTILSIILGVLMAASLKTTQRNIREFGGSTRVPMLVEKLRVQEQANKLLEAQIIDLRKEVTTYQRKLTDGSAASEELLKQLQDAKVAAGLTPVSGPGVVVTLKDSKEIPPPGSPMEVIMEYMVHDTASQCGSGGHCCKWKEAYSQICCSLQRQRYNGQQYADSSSVYC
jgi:uncharacterized protein YlxW (UPF0749 family)